jgi:isopenicillin N synthase-like dioxygenase
MIIYTSPTVATRIPVIDLSKGFSSDPGSRKRVAAEIHRACRETGFFYVENHGVPQQLVDDQFAWSQRFFRLLNEAKLELYFKKSPATAGYVPPGGQILDSQDAKAEKAPPDLNESFYCGTELPDDHPYAVWRWRSFGYNQWPSALPGFREQMLTWQGEMRRLGDRLLSQLALSLEIPEDWFEPYFDMPTMSLRLLHYPPHPDTARPNQLGAGAHTDWGGITLLLQDSVGGLEVRNASGDWIEAPPIPGTFVINLGDLMARWTNGIYNSNMHRVKNNKSKTDRYSIPFFYSPRPDAVIEPIPTCVDLDHPRRFETCTSAEHIAEMFRRSHGYEPGRTVA